MNSDKMILKELKFNACHGVLDFEKTTPQLFIIDVELNMNLSKACESDDLFHTINYGDIYLLIKKIVENNTYNLIEHLAHEIAKGVLHFNTKIQALSVTVKKPDASVDGDFSYMGITINRSRTDYYEINQNKKTV